MSLGNEYEDWLFTGTPEEHKRARASTTRSGWLLDGLYFGLTLGGLTMAAAPLVALMPKEWWPFLVIAGWSKALPVYAIFIAVPLFIVPRVLASRGWAREVEHARALPFELSRFVHRLGVSPRSRFESRHEMTLELAGAGPKPELLVQLLDEPGVTWEAKLKGDRYELERSPGLGDRSDTNFAFARWWRRFVDVKLLPLHADMPIKRITFKT